MTRPPQPDRNTTWLSQAASYPTTSWINGAAAAGHRRAVNAPVRERPRFVEPRVTPDAEFGQGLPRLHLVAHRGAQQDSGAVVDGRVQPLTAGAKQHRGAADALGVDADDEAGPLRRDVLARGRSTPAGCSRPPPRRPRPAARSTARILSSGRAAGDDARSRAPAPRPRRRPVPATTSIWLASVTDNSVTSAGPRPFKVSKLSMTSSALPTARPERGLHRGQHGPRGQSDPPANLHHRTASCRAWSARLHERAPPDLDVEDQRIGALGDLLAHDRGRDQRHALDRAGDVAKRVELLVGWRQVRGLPHKHTAKFGQDREALGRRHVDPEPGNRLELVDGAAGMPERTARSSSAPARRRRRRWARRRARSCRPHRPCCACRPSRPAATTGPPGARIAPWRRSATRSRRDRAHGTRWPSAGRPSGTPESSRP